MFGLWLVLKKLSRSKSCVVTTMNPIETVPKTAAPVILCLRCSNGDIIDVAPCYWLPPWDVDDAGTEFYVYDECGWWHKDPDDPDWVCGGSVEIVGWKPHPVMNDL